MTILNRNKEARVSFQLYLKSEGVPVVRAGRVVHQRPRPPDERPRVLDGRLGRQRVGDAALEVGLRRQRGDDGAGLLRRLFRPQLQPDLKLRCKDEMNRGAIHI